TSAALTRRCSPFVTSVTTTAARRAARSALSALRISSFMTTLPARSVGPLPPCGGGLGRGVAARTMLQQIDEVHPRDLSALRYSRTEELQILVLEARHHALCPFSPQRRHVGHHQSRR